MIPSRRIAHAARVAAVPLDFDAALRDDGEPRRAGQPQRLVAGDAELEPRSGAPLFIFMMRERASQLLDAIAAAGFDAPALIADELLELVPAGDAYLRAGRFRAGAMLAFVAGVIERARERGHRKLLVSGEMTWSLSGAPGSDEMIDDEDRLNDLLRHSPDVTIVCHYSTERFDARVTLEALRVHPFVHLPAGLFRGFHSGRTGAAPNS
jgi:hypothetical protein